MLPNVIHKNAEDQQANEDDGIVIPEKNIAPAQPQRSLLQSAGPASNYNSNPFQNTYTNVPPNAMHNYAEGPIRRKSTLSEYQFFVDRLTPAEIMGDFPVCSFSLEIVRRSNPNGIFRISVDFAASATV